jgi:5'-3' exoribonuclease 1
VHHHTHTCVLPQAKYYTEKLELPDASPRWTSEVVHHYIRGLHWVLQYYYRGVASWDWFYPYHYAPMAQDMRVLGDIDGEQHCLFRS